MITYLVLVLTIGGPGWLVLSVLQKTCDFRLPTGLYIPLSWFIGMGILYLELFGWALVWPHSLWPISLLLWINLACAGYCLWQKRGTYAGVYKRISTITLSSLYPFVGLVCIGGFLTLVLCQTHLSHDFIHGDSVTYYFIKAKMFFEDGYVSPTQLASHAFVAQDPQTAYSLINPQYPLLVPLMITWVYMVAQQPAIWLAKYLWLSMGIGTIWILAYIGKVSFPRWQWAVIVLPLLWLSIPTLWSHFFIQDMGYADLWLSAFYIAGLWCAHCWLMEKQTGYLVLCSIFLSMALVTKSEAIWVLLCVPWIWFSHGWRRYRRPKAIATLILLGVSLTWFYFLSTLPAVPTYTQLLVPRLADPVSWMDRVVPTGFFMIRRLVDVSQHNLLWIGYWILLTLSMWKQLQPKSLWWIQAVVFLGLGVHGIHYVISPFRHIELQHFVNISFDRYVASWSASVLMLMAIMTKSMYHSLSHQSPPKPYA